MVLLTGKEAKRGKKRKLGAEDSAAAGSQNAMQAFSKVVAYCTHTACRRMMVLQHFGERLSAGACSGCDYCSNAQLVHTQVGSSRLGNHAPHLSWCAALSAYVCHGKTMHHAIAVRLDLLTV